VLIIVLDAARRDAVHSALRNSTLPELQQATEVCLLSPSCWTVPSMGSLVTGLFPSEHGLQWPLAGTAVDEPAMASLPARVGQRFRIVSANEVYAPPLIAFPPGTADFVLRRRPSWVNRALRAMSLADYGGRECLRSVRELLAGGRVPDLLLVHMVEAHHPYLLPPAGLALRARAAYSRGQFAHVLSKKAQVWEYAARASAQAWARAKERYLECLHYSTRLVEQMVQAYKDAGLLEQTLVLVTADHGEHLGEHGLADHQASLYDRLVHVPGLLVGPDLPAVIPGQFQHTDLLLTCCNYLGVPLDGYEPAWPPLDMLEPANWERGHEHAFLEWKAWDPKQLASLRRRNPSYDFGPLHRDLVGVRTREWKYVRGSDGSRLLLNLREDPDEEHDVLDGNPEAAAALEARLEEWRGRVMEAGRRAAAARMAGETSDVVEQRLQDLGYL